MSTAKDWTGARPVPQLPRFARDAFYMCFPSAAESGPGPCASPQEDRFFLLLKKFSPKKIAEKMSEKEEGKTQLLVF